MTKTEIVKKLQAINNALIICHFRPDGDTLSSAFSLKYAFEKLGKTAEVYCSDPIPEKFHTLDFLGKLTEKTDGYDALIFVDVSNIDRSGDASLFFRKYKETFNIDHHISNENFAKYNYVSDQTANAINVFDVIMEMGVQLDEKLANLLYLGLCTDSGNFSQSNVNARAFAVASTLAKYGAKTADIYNKMYKNQSVARAKLYARVQNGIKFFHDGKLAIVTTFLKDLKEFELDSSVNEGFVDFPLSVGSVEIAISILQTDDKTFKLSFRSKSYVDVNDLASTFGGGGHVRASGAILCGFYEDIIDKLVYICGTYLC